MATPMALIYKVLFPSIATFDPPPFHGCFLVVMWMSDLGHIDTVFRTVGRCGRQTSSTRGGAMSELNDFNQRVIREFRANQGRVSGQLANMPVLLLTMTGARSGRTLTTPLVYTTDGDRLVVIASFAGAPKHPAWYHNLLAHPEATLEVASQRFRATATGTAGEQRQRLLDHQPPQMRFFSGIRKKPSRRSRASGSRALTGPARPARGGFHPLV